VIYDKLTSISDKRWFLRTVNNTAKDILKSHEYEMFPKDMQKTVFVEFMRDMIEPTGDEPDDFVPEVPKIYEPVEEYVINFNHIL